MPKIAVLRAQEIARKNANWNFGLSGVCVPIWLAEVKRTVPIWNGDGASFMPIAAASSSAFFSRIGSMKLTIFSSAFEPGLYTFI